MVAVDQHSEGSPHRVLASRTARRSRNSGSTPWRIKPPSLVGSERPRSAKARVGVARRLSERTRKVHAQAGLVHAPVNLANEVTTRLLQQNGVGRCRGRFGPTIGVRILPGKPPSPPVAGSSPAAPARHLPGLLAVSRVLIKARNSVRLDNNE